MKQTLGNKYWRLSNLYKINSKYNGVGLFELNKVQQRIYREFAPQLPKRDFTLKGRQGGISTFFLLWYLDKAIWNDNVTVGILAHKWDSLKYLFEIIRYALDSMPKNFRPIVGDFSKTTLSFPKRNSKIFVSLEIRSVGLTDLHISEWCLCDDDKVIASIAAVGPKGNISGESTGFGVGNHGYNTYFDGKLGLNGYNVRFVPWHEIEYYKLPISVGKPSPDGLKTNGKADLSDDLTKTIPEVIPTQEELSLGTILSPEQILFRRQAKRDLGKLFPQEMAEDDDTCFLASGGAFFDNKKIHVLFKSAKLWRSQNKPDMESDDYVAFFHPVHKHIYVCGADTAEGLRHGDYCSLKIIDATAKQEVFAYRARVGIDKFAQILDHWGRRYNNALMGVERNNHGHAVLAWLENSYRYPNLYKEAIPRNVVGFDDKEPKLGWATTKTSKPHILDMLRVALEGAYEDDELHFNPDLLFLDQIFLQECLTFVENSGKYEAAEGKFDDTVMATAIAYQMYQNIASKIIQGTSGGEAGIFTGNPREAEY